MWFKNLTIFTLDEPLSDSAEDLHEALAGQRFRPCPPHEPQTQGWAAPLGRNFDQLTHGSGPFTLMKLTREERLLPASVLREQVAERVEAIEDKEGRKVSRREQKEIRENLENELLPRAFTRRQSTTGYFDTRNQWLIVGNATDRRIQEFTTLLRNTLGSLPIKPLRVAEDPAIMMTDWLMNGTKPGGFTIEDECVLRDADDPKNVARLRQQDLGSDEVRTHLEAGKLVSELGLSWNDRVRFVLGDDLRIRRLRFLDTVEEELEDTATDTPEQQLDARFTLMALELEQLIPALAEAFGGPEKTN